ncbi:MAG: hypothetical protein AUI83_18690 [Armatimonadetes bacterium 13_1_40CM_3_65_7]|uniref:Uncharacterized protein n=1 Tax=Candidatus Segetimicrobium genomatis TaxID=2569760 RepID=A0A537KYI0_9BACT|nr:MAG: hypothetical protein AUI83_18690 [Armatimonadetes bacterium 13_1_40CM_3_65_7]TMJ00577.1 MAG: hypothetical protein E6H01_09145 [Terrabacteria group bacterium ANGP1]
MKGTGWIAVIVVVAVAAFAGQMVSAQGYGSDYDKAGGAGTVDAMKTARTHATNAARSETLRDSLWHLGHVVNCLEGKGGKNYDANNLNPCQGQGGGILPDLQAAARSYQMGASTALDLSRKAEQMAMDTLKLTDLAQVKTGASKVADTLGEALKALGQ